MSTTRTTSGVGRAAVTGVVAGVIASLVMAMYAMIAAWIQDTGFFTPLYHIASVVVAPDTMTASMESGMAGDAFTFSFGVAVLGAVVHMMTGAMYGAVFGLIVARLRLGAAALTVTGLAWGAVVLVMSAFVLLPLTAAVTGAGEPVANMASMAGWGTFTVEHLLFGITLGGIFAARLPHAVQQGSPVPA
ncbi:hypothetical protein [Myceligenerans indicum]|uniref:DUF1440 domain-containing protein n=1 Tax=Myceligenerans indicum TaxID=2593663 RepID=A0ABS1LGG4_9MICO|nr:hypothetical protein [Myceligenerans indicum]MBL0885244.1 hypothetical protein [Myceligenerans indicum]